MDHTDNVAQRALDAVDLAEAMRLRVRGAHWNEIAARCGYPSPAAALRAVGEAMAAATQRATETADQLRNTASMQFDALLSEAWTMMETEAPEAYDAEGNLIPSDDRAVRLRAIDEARRLIEAKAKLNRLGDKPKEDENAASGGIRILGVAVEDIV